MTIRNQSMRRQTAGFTLIEIMVVVAIIGIIMAIALPSYNEYMRKTRRAAAGSCLTAMAQAMERHYTVKLAYNDTTPTAATLSASCDPDLKNKYYNMDRDMLGLKTFRVTATPKGAQSGDACGTLTVNQAGAKTPTTGNCW